MSNHKPAGQKRRNPSLTGIDWSLIGVAAASAVGSSWFAIHMVTSKDRRNFVFGAEHLGIFGRPSTVASQRGRAPGEGVGVDMTPIGAISSDQAAKRRDSIEPLTPPPSAAREGDHPKRAETPAQGETNVRLDAFTVHDVIGDQALIMGPSGLTAVRVGANLGVAGIVQKFELTRRGWVVVTTRGRLEPVP